MKTLRPSRPQAAGFTLVEIMIVVLIIGILLAIAVPNFVAARESSRAKACVGNLKQIDSACQQYDMDNHYSSTTYTAPLLAVGPSTTSLCGATSYIRQIPTCPSSGAYTMPASVTVVPTCSITGAAGSGYEAPAGATPAGKWWHGIQ